MKLRANGALSKTVVTYVLIASAVVLSCKARKEPVAEAKESTAKGEACSSQGMEARRKATFERTTGCVADAVGLRLADVIQNAALAAGELKAFANAIKTINRLYGDAKDFPINVAKGAFCAKVFVGDYLPVKTLTHITDRVVRDEGGALGQLTMLDNLAVKISTASGLDALKALFSIGGDPGLENILKAMAMVGGSMSDIFVLINSCAPVFTSVLDGAPLSTVRIVKLSESAANIGVYAAIANCAAAGLFNAIDVGSEYSCLMQDLAAIREQNEIIANMEGESCKKLEPIANAITSIPMMKMTRSINDIDPKTKSLTESSTRRFNLCNSVNYSWGNCLETHRVALHSENWCTKLCQGDDREAKQNFDSIAAEAGLDPARTRELVKAYNSNCITPGNPPGLVNDGIAGCVKKCMENPNHR